MCTICEKAFDCPSKLLRHQNTHAGIRPYKCDICGKALSRPEHLKRHRMTHDPDKQKQAYTKSKGSKNKSGKCTVATNTSPPVGIAESSSGVGLQGGMNSNENATVVISSVKQEMNEEHRQQQQQQGAASILTCQLLDQKNSASADAAVVVGTSLPPGTMQQQQQQQFVMATPGSEPQQGATVIPWSQVAVAGTSAAAAAAGMRATLVDPQLVRYSPHVAMLHPFAFGGGGGSGTNGGQQVVYQRPPSQQQPPQQQPQNMSSSSSTSAAPTGMPVFPAVTEMR